MHDEIRLAVASDVDDELVTAMQQLLVQLSSSAPMPGVQELREIVASECTTLLIARDPAQANRIVGSLTLAVFRIPTGVRAWIEDVIVDASARGKGVGEALSREAIRIAQGRGARTVELTSRSSREAANRLYRRLGFVARDTNVYRYSASVTNDAS
jgi:ribosomal protein S18 acetylase RimI-like enzyme